MTKEELRTRVEAELLTGVSGAELSKKYETPYPTIQLWRKALLAEKETTEISELTQHTKASLQVIKNEAEKSAPGAAGKIAKIIEGVEGLKELEPEFHTAMQKAVKIAQGFLDATDEEGTSTITIKEWQLITSTLANTYSALFNKAGTTVNVAQTNVNASSENLSFFKSSQKV